MVLVMVVAVAAGNVLIGVVLESDGIVGDGDEGGAGALRKRKYGDYWRCLR